MVNPSIPTKTNHRLLARTAPQRWYNTSATRIATDDQEAHHYRQRRSLQGSSSSGWPRADQPLPGRLGAASRCKEEDGSRLPTNGSRRGPRVGGAGVGRIYGRRRTRCSAVKFGGSASALRSGARFRRPDPPSLSAMTLPTSFSTAFKWSRFPAMFPACSLARR